MITISAEMGDVRTRRGPFAYFVGAISAVLVIPGSFLLWGLANEAAFSAPSLPELPRMVFGSAPFILIWMGSLPLILLLSGHLGRRFGLKYYAMHGAVCGILYYALLAALFYDPDDMGSLHDAPHFLAYSLLDWELYPVFALAGAVCGLIFAVARSGIPSRGIGT